MSQFSDIMTQGVALMEAECGSSFVIDGRTETFVGVLNQHRKGQRLGMGGYAEESDSILMVSKAQFGTTPPINGKRITIENRRYVIAEVDEDSSTYTLMLNGINK